MNVFYHMYWFVSDLFTVYKYIYYDKGLYRTRLLRLERHKLY